MRIFGWLSCGLNGVGEELARGLVALTALVLLGVHDPAPDGFNQARAGQAQGFAPAGQGAPGGPGEGVLDDGPHYGTNDLWLEIQGSSNALKIILHNTAPGHLYQLLSQSAVTNTDWSVEQELVGAPGQLETWLAQDQRSSRVFKARALPIGSTNRAPAIHWAGMTSNYFIGSPPVVIDGAGLLTDVDSPDFAGGKLSVAFSANGQPDDRLAIGNTSLITVSGSNVLHAGMVIGTCGGGNGTEPLVIRFNALANASKAQALLRNITYANVSSHPLRGVRQVRAVVTDGDGGTSAATYQNINLSCPSAIEALLVMDVSQSLSASDFLKAKQAASNFVSLLDLSVDRVGLVTFAGTAQLDRGLTNHAAGLQTQLLSLATRQGTVIPPAIDLARNQLGISGPGILRVMLLMSDGINGNSAQNNPTREAAAVAKAAGIRVVSIAYGLSNTGTNLMKDLASSPQDFHYAPSASELQGQYLTIAQGLCRVINRCPVVWAGPDQKVYLTNGSLYTYVTLEGAAQDDGLPVGSNLSFAWSKAGAIELTGYLNETCLFSSTTTSNTIVGFGSASEGPGLYTLRLTARDGDCSANDEVQVAVFATGSNQAPLVDAGPPQSTLVGANLILRGVVLDDDLPAGQPLTMAWALESGPPGAQATIADPSVAETGVIFNEIGQYRLRLSGTDGAGASGTNWVTITVCEGTPGPVDVMLVLDRSGSMAEKTFYDAQQGAKALVELLNPITDQVGLISFADTASVDRGLNSDLIEIQNSIDALLASGPTATGLALEAAHRELTGVRHHPGAAPVIVLLSDGVPGSVLRDELPEALRAANAAKNAGLRIITIWVDSCWVNRYPCWLDDHSFEQQLLRQMASADEDFYLVKETTALRRIYASIAQSFCLPRNRRPIVYAGENVGLRPGEVLAVAGQTSDDGLPNQQLHIKWTGSPGVSFENEQALATLAHFSGSGRYTNRLSVTDGAATNYHEFIATVNQPPHCAILGGHPVLLEGSDAPSGQLTLRSIAGDRDYFPVGGFELQWSQLSGPAGAIFSDPTDFETTVTFAKPGQYGIKLTADDSLNRTSHVVVIEVMMPLSVQAWLEGTEEISGATHLNGLVTDHRQPAGSYEVHWSQVEGPGGTVTFSAPDQEATSATFSGPGTYTLRLTARDGVYSASSELTMRVDGIVVDAGPDQLIGLGQTALLSGLATNSNGSELPVQWRAESGPGAVTFVNGHAAQTGATFTQPGVYHLVLESAQGGDRMSVTVNQAPEIQIQLTSPGPITVGTRIGLAGTITDDGLPAGAGHTMAWSKASGPGEVKFGETNAPSASAHFTAPGTYVLELSVHDSHLTGSGTITLHVQAGLMLRDDIFTVDEESSQNLLDVLANDVNPGDLFITAVQHWNGLGGASGAGELSIVGRKQLLFTPAPNVFGSVHIAYTVTDARGASATTNALIAVRAVNDPPQAVGDFYKVALNSTGTTLPVLDNDTDPDLPVDYQGGDDYAPSRLLLHITTWTNPGHGDVELKDQFINASPRLRATDFHYRPAAGYQGWDSFGYTVADDHGLTSSATVTLWVTNNTSVNLPAMVDAGADQTVVLSGLTVSVPLQATVLNETEQGTVISWQVDPGAPGEVTFNPYNKAATTATLSQLGTYKVKLQVWDGFETASDSMTIQVVRSDPTPPLARLLSLANDPNGLAPIPLVTEGFHKLRGIADDPNLDESIGYRLLLYRPAAQAGETEQLVGNVTPGTRDGQGYHWIPNFGRVRGLPGNDILGDIDFSTLRNGVYLLELSVLGGHNPVPEVDRARFALSSELKLGQFSFSQTDLVIPVNGLQLAVTRTYNSQKTEEGDFGPAWSFAVKDLEIELDEERDQFEDEAGELFNMRTGGGRNVTLTLPNGQRTTFAFGFRSGPFHLHGEYYSAPGVEAALEMKGDNRLVPTLGALTGTALYYWQQGQALVPMDQFDFPGWTLTTLDGTQYDIERERQSELGYFLMDGTYIDARKPPRLRRIRYPTGERVEISPAQIEHRDASNVLTRSITFQRDQAGRIIGLHDPLGTASGPWAVRYEYFGASDFGGNLSDPRIGNLKNVLRLVNRTGNGGNGIYETNSYSYGVVTNGTVLYPHYITRMVDARGLTPLRNQYDESGKLKSVIDVDGRKTEFTYDTANPANRKTVITDALTNQITHYFDATGHVTRTTIIDAQGQWVQALEYTYDDRGNLLTQSGSSPAAYEYDVAGRRIAMTSGDGGITRLRYNEFGQPLLVIDPLGQTTQNEYDARGNLLATVDAQNQRTSQTYINNQVDSATDALGNVTRFRYYGPNEVGGRSGDVKAVEFFENREGTLVSRNAKTFTYDLNGNRLMEVTMAELAPGAAPVSLTNTFIYDAQNRLTESRDALYTPPAAPADEGLPAPHATRTIFNTIGKPERSFDKLGRVTRFYYDARGNLVQTLYPDGTITRSVFDPNNRPLYTQDRHASGSANSSILGTTVASGSHTIYDAAGWDPLESTCRHASLSIL